MTIEQTEQAATATGALLPLRMTYEEFLEWGDDVIPAEWVDGEMIELPSPSVFHQTLAGFLFQILGMFVNWNELGLILAAPMQMKTGPGLPGREPDVLFVSNENLHRFRKNYLDGPADLVIEIISPEGRNRDSQRKFGEYQQGGVKEFWLIDPTRQSCQFYVLEPDGKYQAAPVPNGIYHSSVLAGCWIKVEWLWQDPLPNTKGVAREWGLV